MSYAFVCCFDSTVDVSQLCIIVPRSVSILLFAVILFFLLMLAGFYFFFFFFSSRRRHTRFDCDWSSDVCSSDLVLICTLEDGRLFVYRDVRRLGNVWLLDEKGWAAYTDRLGPEPLDDTFTPFVFAERLRGTRAAIKKAIMDQRRVAGVGNIYANEALFEAGVDPSKATHKLSLDEFARLHAAVTDVLARAVNSSGTTVRDYCTGTGEEGRFQFELKVYGRGGEACVTCGKKLVTTHTIDLRATTFCPNCQR